MTKWQEFPLRPVGQPWPGLNTRGGRTDPGAGYLEDGSINAIINESDELAKRSGLVRGLDERFSGVVCGLFRYTDDCGRERILVADQDGIFVRTLFELPEFANSDAYPVDGFTELDLDKWNNTDDYEVTTAGLETLAAATPLTLITQSRMMNWFKQASSRSYFTEIQYANADAFPTSVIIKRTTDDYLEASVVSTLATVDLVRNNARTRLITADVTGTTGFLKLTYQRLSEQFLVSLRVVPSGGSVVEETAEITFVDDSALGQTTSIAIGDAAQIISVNGGPA